MGTKREKKKHHVCRGKGEIECITKLPNRRTNLHFPPCPPSEVLFFVRHFSFTTPPKNNNTPPCHARQHRACVSPALPRVRPRGQPPPCPGGRRHRSRPPSPQRLVPLRDRTGRKVRTRTDCACESKGGSAHARGERGGIRWVARSFGRGGGGANSASCNVMHGGGLHTYGVQP